MSANVFRIGNAVKTNEILRIYSRVFCFAYKGMGAGIGEGARGVCGATVLLGAWWCSWSFDGFVELVEVVVLVRLLGFVGLLDSWGSWWSWGAWGLVGLEGLWGLWGSWWF